jgi:hypothetical protein
MGSVQRLYLGGRWTDGAGTFLVHRYDGELLAEVASASAAQGADIMAAAKRTCTAVPRLRWPLVMTAAQVHAKPIAARVTPVTRRRPAIAAAGHVPQRGPCPGSDYRAGAV